MGWVALILTALMVAISLGTRRVGDEAKALRWEASDFRPGHTFVVGSVLVVGALAALYAIYW
jgi:hypothetical protein